MRQQLGSIDVEFVCCITLNVSVNIVNVPMTRKFCVDGNCTDVGLDKATIRTRDFCRYLFVRSHFRPLLRPILYCS